MQRCYVECDWRGYLCQVEVCLLQQVWVVHAHQPDHVVQLLVGLVHGNGLVMLTNAHIDSAAKSEGKRERGRREEGEGGEGGEDGQGML